MIFGNLVFLHRELYVQIVLNTLTQIFVITMLIIGKATNNMSLCEHVKSVLIDTTEHERAVEMNKVYFLTSLWKNTKYKS